MGDRETARARSTPCDEAVRHTGATFHTIDYKPPAGNKRSEFATSAIGNHDANPLLQHPLKKQPRTGRLRGRSMYRLQTCHLPQHQLGEVDTAITTRLDPSLSPPTTHSNSMDKGPDLSTVHENENPQEESSSAAARRGEIISSESPAPSPSPQSSSYRTATEDPSASTTTTDPDSGHASPVYKASATTQVCALHELCYSSQYTRPVEDMLTEVLEVRYPVESGAATMGPSELRPLLGEAEGRNDGDDTCGWMHRLWGLLRTR